MQIVLAVLAVLGSWRVNGAARWFVLLIGGPSGIGKTTVAAQVARRLDVPWLMVDDLRLALMRSGLPIPDNPRAGAFDPEDGLVAVGEAVASAIEVVIENHVDQRIPVVIEGDGILPRCSSATRCARGLLAGASARCT